MKFFFFYIKTRTIISQVFRSKLRGLSFLIDKKRENLSMKRMKFLRRIRRFVMDFHGVYAGLVGTVFLLLIESHKYPHIENFQSPSHMWEISERIYGPETFFLCFDDCPMIFSSVNFFNNNKHRIEQKNTLKEPLALKFHN